MRTSSLVLFLAACVPLPITPSVSIGPDGADTTSELELEINDPAGQRDDVNYAIEWTRDGQVVSSVANSTRVPPGETSRGDLWQVAVQPLNRRAKPGPIATAEITIGNAPPRIQAVTLRPPSPRSTDAITANATGVSDPDGDAVEIRFSFQIDGVEVYQLRTAETSATMDSSVALSRDQRIVVVATPTDNITAGEPVSSDEIVVQNTPPTAPEIEISPEGPGAGDDLICLVVEEATDPDGDDLTYSFSWTRDGEPWTGETHRTHHDGDTILAAHTADEEVWTCAAFASDGADEGPEVSSEPVTVISCANPGGGPLSWDNGTGTGDYYCYEAGDSLEVLARKACESHHGIGACCVITGGYRSEQYGLCGSGGGSGTIHWHPDSHPDGHCAPHYVPGDVVSPGWCGSIIGSFLPPSHE